jgi:hypothetical protein
VARLGRGTGRDLVWADVDARNSHVGNAYVAVAQLPCMQDAKTAASALPDSRARHCFLRRRRVRQAGDGGAVARRGPRWLASWRCQGCRHREKEKKINVQDRTRRWTGRNLSYTHGLNCKKCSYLNHIIPFVLCPLVITLSHSIKIQV